MTIHKSETILGIDLGGTKVAAGKVNKGTLIEKIDKKIDAASEDPMDTVRLISELISRLDTGNVSGIGIGVPGLVNRERGIAYDVLNIPSWKEVHLRTMLENEFHVPVYLDNDSNCFAMGEYRYGSYAGIVDFVGITLGTGMGSGIIKNGSLMPDANCCSGEFGNIPYKDGIYEHYCSGMFFANKYGQNGEEVAIEAGKGIPWAIEAFKEFGMHLGNAIKTIIMAVDPTMVIIGGSVAKASKLFEDSMWKSISDFSFPSTLPNFQVKFSHTEHIAILGAAALCNNKPNSLTKTNP
jgi:glucokinase